MSLKTIILCPMCKKLFEESGQVECCVGGHWTPHSSEDSVPEFVVCCHQFQEEVIS